MPVPRGEVFARTGSQAKDPVKGRDAQRVLAAAEALRSSGVLVARLEINHKNHVLYRAEGKTHFLCALESGLEFPEELGVI